MIDVHVSGVGLKSNRKKGLSGEFTTRVDRTLRRRLGFRLGQFAMYPPRPICLSKKYRTSHTAPNPLKLSIVTPVLNQSKFIGATVESILGQNYPFLEYIVIDGGSRDGTTEILRKYRDQLSYFDSRPDNGQSDAINRGMQQASGEVLAWINGDDLLLPGALHYVSDFFTSHPDIDVIYGHRIIINVTGEEIGRWVLPRHNGRILSWMDFVPQETLFWRRRVWDRVGARIDDSFKFAMDWDLLIRLRDSGAKFARVPRYLGAFRVHPKQKTLAEMSRDGIAEMNRIRLRCLGRIPSKAEMRLAVAPYALQHMLLDRCNRLLRLY